MAEPEHAFQYAILRAVPSLQRGEAINVGVVLHCRRLGFLAVRTKVDRRRLGALDPSLDVAALERHLAGEYHAARPRGGHHVWVTLNRPIDERSLYSEALRHGVSFTPGGSVSAFKTTQTSLRLSFPLVDPEQLDEGVRRLARAVREVRRRERHRTTMPVS